MIVGIGVDIESIVRWKRLRERFGERLEKRLFTEGEIAFCCRRSAPDQHFAVRFAAKEAAMKALRGRGAMAWREFEITTEPSGAPTLQLWGRAATWAQHMGVRQVHISLSHAAGVAVAMVILVGANETG